MPVSQTRRFKQLESAVNTLNSMLPSPKVNGKYTNQEQINIKAYRLLCHAEIEAYLEDIAEKCIDNVFNKWRIAGKTNAALVHFSVFEGWGIDANIAKDTNTRLGHLIQKYKQKIRDNHGIKETNIKTLFLPLGINLNSMNILVADLNTFGSDRGAIAHTAMKTHSMLDPVVEKTRVAQIINELKILDDEVRKIS